MLTFPSKSREKCPSTNAWGALRLTLATKSPQKMGEEEDFHCFKQIIKPVMKQSAEVILQMQLRLRQCYVTTTNVVIGIPDIFYCEKNYWGIWNTNLEQLLCGHDSVTLPTNAEMVERWNLKYICYNNGSQVQIICHSWFLPWSSSKCLKNTAGDFLGS